MAKLFVRVDFDLDLDDDEIKQLLDESSDDSAEKKFLLQEYMNKQTPRLQFGVTSGDETCIFETH